MNHQNKRSYIPLLYLLPVLTVVLFFYGFPFIKNIHSSFVEYSLVHPDETPFNHFENYKEMFADDIFYYSLKNTIIWVVISIIPQLVLGMMLALLLWKRFIGRGPYQSIIFLPWAFSGFLIGIMFRWMFNAQFGVINDVMMKLSLIKEGIPFLARPETSLIGPIVALIWYGIPFFAIMLLAALQSIPTDIFEAAIIDGAGRWARFWRITIPFIKPTLITTVLLRTVWIFNSGDIIYVMTNGGPANSSHILATYLFQKAYSAFDFGYASAIAMVIIAFLLIYTLIYLTATKFESAGDF